MTRRCAHHGLCSGATATCYQYICNTLVLGLASHSVTSLKPSLKSLWRAKSQCAPDSTILGTKGVREGGRREL